MFFFNILFFVNLFCNKAYKILKDLVSDGHHYGVHLICDSSFIIPNEIDLVELFPTKIIHAMNSDRLSRQLIDKYKFVNTNIKGLYCLFTDKNSISFELIKSYYIPYELI